MNSMKKILLFVCLAGSITQMNAGVWQNLKDSCNGFYTACAKSITENSSALSTKTCDAYAACIDTLRSNRDAAAVKLGNVGTSIATGVRATGQKISHGANSAGQAVVKVTAPAVSATKSIANGIANTAIFAYEHPIWVGSGLLAATIAYLKICRNNAFNAVSSINKATAVTDAMDDADLVPHGSLVFWGYHETQNAQGWKNPADILANWEDVYTEFKNEKGNGASEGDICFINRMTKELDAAKKTLNSILKELKNALGEYHLVPTMQSHADRAKNNYVNQVIARYIINYGPRGKFLDLSAQEIEAIDREISNKVSRSLINPVKIARRFALPDEAKVIEQYWKVYQLMQRIEALQRSLSLKQASLNGGLEAR